MDEEVKRIFANAQITNGPGSLQLSLCHTMYPVGLSY